MRGVRLEKEEKMTSQDSELQATGNPSNNLAQREAGNLPYSHWDQGCWDYSKTPPRPGLTALFPTCAGPLFPTVLLGSELCCGVPTWLPAASLAVPLPGTSADSDTLLLPPSFSLTPEEEEAGTDDVLLLLRPPTMAEEPVVSGVAAGASRNRSGSCGLPLAPMGPS